MVFRDQEVPPPPDLRPGSYGFLALARDDTCIWYAYGCTDVTVPTGQGTATVTIENRYYEVECPAEECVAGVCRSENDGGPGDADVADADGEDADAADGDVADGDVADGDVADATADAG